jgi:hypothetical protein
MRSILLLLMVAAFGSNAQNMKLISGSLKPLKGETSFNIRFRYDSMIVGTDMKERDYLAEKKRLWDQKEAGRGSDFVEMWFEDRDRLYEPAFVASFEKFSKKKLYDENAKYTLILRTTRTEGGWNMGAVRHGGEIDGELWVVETANPKNVVAKVGFYHFMSEIFQGGDFEMTERIAPAYTLAGEGLADFVKRKSR